MTAGIKNHKVKGQRSKVIRIQVHNLLNPTRPTDQPTHLQTIKRGKVMSVSGEIGRYLLGTYVYLYIKHNKAAYTHGVHSLHTAFIHIQPLYIHSLQYIHSLEYVLMIYKVFMYLPRYIYIYMATHTYIPYFIQLFSYFIHYNHLPR